MAGRFARRRAFIAAVLVSASVTVMMPTSGFGQARTGIGEEQSRRHLTRAVELFKKRQYAQAEASFKKAVLADPKHIEAYKRYATFLLGRKRFADTEQLLDRGLAHNPGDPQLRAYMAICYCWIGKAEKALSTFKDVAPYISRAAALHFLVAECLLYNGKYGLAVRTLGESLKSPRKKPGKLEFPLRLRYTTALIKVGDLDTAAGQVARLSELKPKSLKVRALKAELLLRRGECKRALKAYAEIATKKEPWLVEQAEANLCLRRYDRVRELLGRYLSKRNKRVWAHVTAKVKFPDLRLLRRIERALVLQGDVLIKLERYKEALESYRVAGKVSGQPGALAMRVAKLYFTMGKYERCLQQLSTVLEEPSPAKPALRLAIRSALRARKKEIASRISHQLLQQSDLSAHDYYMAGITDKSVGRFESAITRLEKAFGKTPGGKSIQRDLGHTYLLQARRDFRRGDLAQAIGRLKKLKKIPAYRATATADKNLALLQLKAGKPQLAAKHALAALRHRGKDRRAMWLAARALAELGRHQKALKWYSKYRKTSKPKQSAMDRAVAAEAAVVMARVGDLSKAVDQLGRAELLVEGSPSAAATKRNLVRARYLLGARLMRRNTSVQAWSLWSRVIAEIGVLQPDGQAAVLARIFFAALKAPKLPVARKLVALHLDTMAAALKEPFRAVGKRLVPLLVGMYAPDAKRKAASAKSLVSVSRSLPSKEARMFRDVASALYQQAAHMALIRRKDALALQLLGRSARLTRTQSAALKHNRAVASYRARRRSSALAALGSVSEAIPVASCNIAVDLQNRGQPRKAYDLFKACQKKGGQYPKLDAIIEFKEHVFGL